MTLLNDKNDKSNMKGEGMLKVLQNIRAYFLALTKVSIYIKIVKSIRHRRNTEGKHGKHQTKPKKQREETCGNTRRIGRKQLGNQGNITFRKSI